MPLTRFFQDTFCNVHVGKTLSLSLCNTLPLRTGLPSPGTVGSHAETRASLAVLCWALLTRVLPSGSTVSSRVCSAVPCLADVPVSAGATHSHLSHSPRTESTCCFSRAPFCWDLIKSVKILKIVFRQISSRNVYLAQLPYVVQEKTEGWRV